MSFVMFGLEHVDAIQSSAWGGALETAHMTLFAVGFLLVGNCVVMLLYMGRAIRYYDRMSHVAHHSATTG